MNTEQPYDLVVIGGGINGVGIAADAAGRGLSVLLCEQNDLASATSSASSKLIHGGLRYLEYYDFALVRESLRERKILYETAPHLVRPIRFAVPFNKKLRPYWFIRLGLFLYDLLGFSLSFKRSKAVFFKANDATSPLKQSIQSGFIYTDCITDDARLVIANAQRIVKSGGKVITRTKCISAMREAQYWNIVLQDTLKNKEFTIKAKALVNATGPWVDEFINQILKIKSKYHLRLVKGSHIIFPKLYKRNEAYVLQNKDGRIVFVIPYLNQFTMVGTTDVNHSGNPYSVKIDPQEIEYLCDSVNEYFHHPILPRQILTSWSGVRALVDDQSMNIASINRGYKLELNTSEDNILPLINVFGGKLTTYRMLGEKAVDMLTPFFKDCTSQWTDKRPLPGGDFPDRDPTVLIEEIAQCFPWLPSSLTLRYVHSYGTLTYELLAEVNSLADLGQDFGHGLYEIEVRYLIQNEWALTADDILWRRTKLGLLFTDSEKTKLENWLRIQQFNRVPLCC